jgi:branched-chain amino acid transport system permease protein
VPSPRRIAVSLIALVAVLTLASRSGYSASIATQALTWGLVGIALMVITGWGNQLSLAHGAFFGVGAYTAVLVERAGLPFLFSPLAAVAVGIVIGILTGLPSLRLRGSFLAVATMAVQFIIEGTLFRWDYLVDETSDANTIHRPDLFSSDFRFFVLTGVITLFCVLVVARLGRGQTGRILKALSGSGLEIQTSGHSLMTYRLLAGVISTVLAIMAGVLFAGAQTRVTYVSFNFLQSIVFLSGAVIGGIGSLWGAFLGLVAAALLPELLRFSPISEAYFGFVLGGLSFLILWLEPGGMAELGRRLTASVKARPRRLARPVEREDTLTIPQLAVTAEKRVV